MSIKTKSAELKLASNRFSERLMPALVKFSVILLLALASGGHAQVNYQFDRIWPTLQQPWYFYATEGLCLDENGSVYVVNRGQRRIDVFSSDGFYESSLISTASGADAFAGPIDVAVNEEAIYVLDRDNRNIKKFSHNKVLLETWGQTGTGVNKSHQAIGLPRKYASDFGKSGIR